MQVSDLKIGDLIKCTHADGNQGVEGERTHSFGVIVKLERPQRRNRNRPNEEQITWAEIQWHEGTPNLGRDGSVFGNLFRGDEMNCLLGAVAIQRRFEAARY